jgi:hypothetical protein
VAIRSEDYPPALVQAPASAGVGLAEELARDPFPDRNWPADWWQRNMDDPICDPDAPDPEPMTARQMAVPPPP